MKSLYKCHKFRCHSSSGSKRLMYHDSISRSLSLYSGKRFRVRACRVDCTFKLRVNELRARAITKFIDPRVHGDERGVARAGGTPLRRRSKVRAAAATLKRRDDSRERASERRGCLHKRCRPANCREMRPTSGVLYGALRSHRYDAAQRGDATTAPPQTVYGTLADGSGLTRL